LEGDEGIGTSRGLRSSCGKWGTIISARYGIKLVTPFSLTEFTITAASVLYVEIAKPVTPKISKPILVVIKLCRQSVQSGAPSLRQTTHGVGKTKSSIFFI
jgi:hypothetical protein